MALRSPAVALLALALTTSACEGGSLADGTCYSARDCSSGESCVSGRCAPLMATDECTRDDQCSATQFCDNGACRERAAITTGDDAGAAASADASFEADAAITVCTADFACGAGNVCEGGACAPGCASAGSPITCGAGEHCEATTGRCAADMPACTADATCGPPGLVCEAGACVPGCAAAGGTPCTGGNVCDNTTGRCVAPPPCPSDAACGAPAAICEAGACVPGCASVGAAACPMGNVCNTNTGRCQAVAGPCTADAQCAAPQTVCEGGQCVPGCAQPGGVQCAGSTACNAGTGRCDPVQPPPCQMDSECGAPASICVASACVAGCASAGCAGTDVCNAATGRCEMPPPPPTCAADAYEDNDTSAAPALGLTAGALVANLTACAMDDDFYAFDLGVGDVLRAEVLFPHAEGDIDIAILTPGGTVGVSGSSVNDDEDVSYTAAAAGRHVLRVFLYRDQGTLPGNGYSVRLTHTPAPPPPMCTPDRLEESDTQATARALTLPVNEAALTSCAMDDDYYALALQPGDQITAALAFSSAEGDVDLRLLDAAGTVLVSSTGVGSSETLTYTALAAATYTLRVNLYGDAGSLPGAAYDLSVTAQAVCPTDALEENDTQAAQRIITAGTFTNLGSCTNDDDYYRVTLAANQTITVNLTFSHAEGDVDLYLLNSAGTTQASSLSVDDDESVTFTPTAAGNYTVRVRLYGDAGTRPGNLYGMQVSY